MSEAINPQPPHDPLRMVRAGARPRSELDTLSTVKHQSRNFKTSETATEKSQGRQGNPLSTAADSVGPMNLK